MSYTHLGFTFYGMARFICHLPLGGGGIPLPAMDIVGKNRSARILLAASHFHECATEVIVLFVNVKPACQVYYFPLGVFAYGPVSEPAEVIQKILFVQKLVNCTLDFTATHSGFQRCVCACVCFLECVSF